MPSGDGPKLLDPDLFRGVELLPMSGSPQSRLDAFGNRALRHRWADRPKIEQSWPDYPLIAAEPTVFRHGLDRLR